MLIIVYVRDNLATFNGKQLVTIPVPRDASAETYDVIFNVIKDNESLLTNYIGDLFQRKTLFRYTVWEKSCVEVADFLTQRQLVELSATYSLIRKIELEPNPYNCQNFIFQSHISPPAARFAH